MDSSSKVSGNIHDRSLLDEDLLKTLSKCYVIIPHKDNHNALASCLGSLLSNMPSSTKFVLVDDGSQIAVKNNPNLAHFCDDPRLHLICHEMNKGAAAARNTGLQWCVEQDAEIAILLDCDCLVESGFVQMHCQLHAHHVDTVCIGGAIEGIGKGIWAHLDNLMSWFTSVPNSPMREVKGLYHIPTTNMSLKLKNLSQEMPLFDARLRTGEDVRFIKLLQAAGYPILFSPQPEIKHCDRQSFKDFIHHQYRWGLHAFIIRGGKHEWHFLIRLLIASLVCLLLPIFAIAASIITIFPWAQRSLTYLKYFPAILCIYFLKGTAIVVGIIDPKKAIHN
jgi:glycosyltransferase involved in cell wall biosynthesis